MEQILDNIPDLTQGEQANLPLHRMLIFIDDIDRCLPEQQVRLLEAIHFLASTRARVVFVVAIDSNMALESLAHRYGSKSFGASTYLDKIFDVRLSLPGEPPFSALLTSLFRELRFQRLKTTPESLLPGETVQNTLKLTSVWSQLEAYGDNVPQHWVDSLQPPRLEPHTQNPRQWQRVVELLRLVLQDTSITNIQSWIRKPEIALSWLYLRHCNPIFCDTLLTKTNRLDFESEYNAQLFSRNLYTPLKELSQELEDMDSSMMTAALRFHSMKSGNTKELERHVEQWKANILAPIQALELSLSASGLSSS